jgi:hypothetical protein
MKLYATVAGSSMDMQDDPLLREQLVELIADQRIDVAIETGTFLGLGSTRFVCEAFLRVAPPRRFVTVEVNFANWCHAKANLRRYPFVDCRWGRSIAMDRALAFLQSDPMLLHHEQYEDIYIDNIADPVTAYTRELLGNARELERNPLADAGRSIGDDAKTLLFDGEDMLVRLLATHADHAPLIVLDSAGGLGFLEFQTVLELMAGRRFALLLDDTHHIKHWRSAQHVRGAAEFHVVAQGASWMLALHP